MPSPAGKKKILAATVKELEKTKAAALSAEKRDKIEASVAEFKESVADNDYKLIFFFNDAATPEIYTLSLHDALPISPSARSSRYSRRASRSLSSLRAYSVPRSEEHTSELQSRGHLVCRLLLEKKKNNTRSADTSNTNKKTQYESK